jgi:hypothetical protein
MSSGNERPNRGIASAVRVSAASSGIEAASPIEVEADSNFPAALLGGLVAAFAGAVVWAVITVTAKVQIGFMAIGVGFLVAWAVRTLGKGHTQLYGIIGGAFALLGCVLGNLLSACGFVATARGESVVSITLSALSTPSLAVNLLRATFDGMDLLFYAIAVYEGYKYSRRPLTQ